MVFLESCTTSILKKEEEEEEGHFLSSSHLCTTEMTLEAAMKAGADRAHAVLEATRAVNSDVLVPRIHNTDRVVFETRLREAGAILASLGSVGEPCKMPWEQAVNHDRKDGALMAAFTDVIHFKFTMAIPLSSTEGVSDEAVILAVSGLPDGVCGVSGMARFADEISSITMHGVFDPMKHVLTVCMRANRRADGVETVLGYIEFIDFFKFNIDFKIKHADSASRDFDFKVVDTSAAMEGGWPSMGTVIVVTSRVAINIQANPEHMKSGKYLCSFSALPGVLSGYVPGIKTRSFLGRGC